MLVSPLYNLHSAAGANVWFHDCIVYIVYGFHDCIVYIVYLQQELTCGFTTV